MWWIWAIETEVPWPKEPTDVTYNGRTFNLHPQSTENYASIAAEAGPNEFVEASKAVHRFLSLLSWIDGRSMRSLWNVGNPGWRQPMKRPPEGARTAFQARNNFDFLPLLAGERAAKAIALYREAVSSSSRQSKFLQYFRVVELAHGRKNAEHPKFVGDLIAKANLQGEAATAVQRLQARNVNVGKQIVIYGRHAVAHGDDKIAIDPDILQDYQLLSELMPIIAALATYTISNTFGVPTRQIYYQQHDYEVEGFRNVLSDDTRDAVLASTEPPLVVDAPIARISIGLRDKHYPALESLGVAQAIMHHGGMTLRLASSGDLVQALIRFDLANQRLHFDIERGVAILDKGTPESADYAADILELLLGLVLNGELHAWDGDTQALLGRKDPNIPLNIDPRATTENLNAEIQRLRAEAQGRRRTS